MKKTKAKQAKKKPPHPSPLPRGRGRGDKAKKATRKKAVRRKTAPAVPQIETTQKAAAARLGVSDRQIRNWIADEQDFPSCAAGYDIAAIQAWQEQRAKKGSTQSATAVEIHLQTSEAKLNRLRIAERKEQIQLDELEGRLLPRELFRELLSALAAMIRETSRELQRAGHGAAFQLIDSMLERYERLLDQRLSPAPESGASAAGRR